MNLCGSHSSITNLPNEILWSINIFLDIKSSNYFIMVNKQFYHNFINDMYDKKLRFTLLKYYFKRLREKLFIQQVINFIQDMVIDRLNN